MKLAIITGGSRGLGKALVDLFQADGWEVLEISRSGTGMAHFSLDLACLDARFDALQEKFKALSSKPWESVSLINNAGVITPIVPVHLQTDSDAQANLNCNFNSAIRVIAAFVRCFFATKGRKIIVNVSSGVALDVYPAWSLYCAAKAGMDHFIRALAVEQQYCTDPICCINFAPGVIDTEMQAQIRGSRAEYFPELGRFVELFESGKLFSAELVASALFQLCNGKDAWRLENGRRYGINELIG